MEETFASRKSTRISTPPKRRVKQTINAPRKRRKTLQISSSKFEEETSDRPVEAVDQEAKTSVGCKAWKPKVENLNMQIINDNNFVQLNKYSDLYNRLLNRKRRVIEEDKHIRINMVMKLCFVNNEEDVK